MIPGLSHEQETDALALIGTALMERVPVDELRRLFAHYLQLGGGFEPEQDVLRAAIGRRA